MSTLLGALLVLLAGCMGNQSGALCAASSVEVRPSGSSPGESVVVMGEHFFRGCNDIGGSPPTEEMVPARDIRIEFRQGSQSWTLATVDATSDYSFKAVVQIPSAATEGPAAVVALAPQGEVEVEFGVS